jgi:deoxycytidylate deaminase
MLNEAINRASLLQNQKQRICAIITDKRGRILSTGENSYSKSHPLQAYYCELARQDNHKIYIHAELQALVNLKGNKKADKIYLARISKTKEPLPCTPCPICRLAIADAGIKNIIHT